MRHRRDEVSDVAVALTALGQLWMAGVTIHWPDFHGRENRRRVALPTYPFDRRRHWIEPPGKTPGGRATRSLRRRQDRADWFYLPSWTRSLPPPAPDPAALAAAGSRWLLFVDPCGLGAAIARYLEEAGCEVIRVLPAAAFRPPDDGTATIDPGRREDYDALIDRLREQDRLPAAVVHLWSVEHDAEDGGDGERYEQIQRRGFDAVLSLTGALRSAGGPVTIGVVSSQVQRVTGEEVLSPARATLLGPCRALAGQDPNLRLSAIDVVVPAAEAEVAALALRLLSELTAPAPAPIVAWRGIDRWLPILHPVRLEAELGRRWQLREGGAYLLTEGLGPVGFEIVKRLAGLAPVRLLFLEPRALPPRDEWQRWLAAGEPSAPGEGDEEEVRERLRRVRELEKRGAEVMVLAPDLTDRAAVGAALDQARERLGPLRGVLHLAAQDVPDPAAAAPGPDAGPGEIRSPFARKTLGALVLDSLLDREPLDFFVAFSSFAAMPALARQAGHGASTALLDVLAHHRARRGGYNVAIDWGQNVGFRDALDHYPEFLQALRQSGLAGDDLNLAEMTGDEAFDALSRIMGGRLVPQIIASTQDAERLAEAAAEAELGGAATEVRTRPELKVDYVAPGNPVDQMIAGIWQEVLGVAQVGVHDNFFDLGGDSLVALRIITRLRETLKLEVEVQALFDNPTVAGLGTAVEEAMTETLEQLSEEETLRIMEMVDHGQ